MDNHAAKCSARVPGRVRDKIIEPALGLSGYCDFRKFRRGYIQTFDKSRTVEASRGVLRMGLSQMKIVHASILKMRCSNVRRKVTWPNSKWR